MRVIRLLAFAAPLLCAGQINIPPASVPAQTPQSAAKPALDRQTIAKLESSFEDSIRLLDEKDPFVLLGATSGVYVSGYGVIFTTPLDLIGTPRATPFQREITKAQADRVRQTKLAHVPLLKKAMRDAVVAAAHTINTLPPQEKIVVAARIFYLDWENKSGLPSQIVLTADRQSALAGDIQSEEQ